MRSEKEVGLWRGMEKSHKAKGRTEFLPSMCEALGSTLATQRKKKNEQGKRKDTMRRKGRRSGHVNSF